MLATFVCSLRALRLTNDLCFSLLFTHSTTTMMHTARSIAAPFAQLYSESSPPMDVSNTSDNAPLITSTRNVTSSSASNAKSQIDFVGYGRVVFAPHTRRFVSTSPIVSKPRSQLEFNARAKAFNASESSSNPNRSKPKFTISLSVSALTATSHRGGTGVAATRTALSSRSSFTFCDSMRTTSSSSRDASEARRRASRSQSRGVPTRERAVCTVGTRCRPCDRTASGESARHTCVVLDI
mmetsp:Transcript_6983/g.28145  ORF Transcript_6983/g.28145 Transcript_6983/m.28145 type:complete len:239 (-) Transcript_6983:4460-5176(-)